MGCGWVTEEAGQAAKEASYDGWVADGVRKGWLQAGAGVWEVGPTRPGGGGVA